MQLPERLGVEPLYEAYHQILDGEEAAGLDYSDLAPYAKLLFANVVGKNQLRHKYIKKFLGRVAGEELLKKLRFRTET